MNAVQIEQKSFEMPPKEGISVACFLTVAKWQPLIGHHGMRCPGWPPIAADKHVAP
jgi:hypothetical protein